MHSENADSPKKQVMLEIMMQIDLVDLEFRNVGILEHEKENEKCYSLLEETAVILRKIGGVQPEETEQADESASTFPWHTDPATRTDPTANTTRKPKFPAEATTSSEKTEPLNNANNPWNDGWKEASPEESETYDYKEKIIRAKISEVFAKLDRNEEEYWRSRGLGDYYEYVRNVASDKVRVSWRRNVREQWDTDEEGHNELYLESNNKNKAVWAELKRDLETLNVDASYIQRINHRCGGYAELSNMFTWKRGLGRRLTQAEVDKMTEYALCVEALLPESQHEKFRDLYLTIYTRDRRAKLRRIVEEPLDENDIDLLSVAEIEEKERTVDDLRQRLK